MLFIVPCTVTYESYFVLLLLPSDSLWVFQLCRITESMNHDPKLRETEKSFKKCFIHEYGFFDTLFNMAKNCSNFAKHESANSITLYFQSLVTG